MSTVKTNISIDSELKLKATEMASEHGLLFSRQVDYFYHKRSIKDVYVA